MQRREFLPFLGIKVYIAVNTLRLLLISSNHRYLAGAFRSNTPRFFTPLFSPATSVGKKWVSEFVGGVGSPMRDTTR